MVAAVTELCRRVDGLPLAIELAASRARAMSPVELLALLDERLDVLRTREAGRPERHRSVRAAIDVSVDLLDEPGRSFFHRLGALAGTFDLDLAHAVAAPDPDDRLLTVDLVTELIDRSLVVPEATATRTRYRLLELVRDHARDALRAEGRWNEANERLTEVLASEADAILRDGVTSWSAELISRVIENVGNLSTALDWCIAHDARPHRAVRLFLPLFAAAHQSRSAEVRALGDRILERWPSEPAPLRAEALAVLATAYAVGGQPQRCSELAHQALADAGLTAIGEVVAHRALTIAAIGAGDVERALEHATTGRGVARAAGLHPFERELAGFEASLLDRDGHPDEADALAHEAAAASLAAGDQITEIWARLVIATVAMRSGRFDAARASIDQAQATSHAIQGVWWGGAIFRSQALLASYEAAAVGSDDGWEASRELWRRAIQQAARRGDLPELALTLKLAAVVAARADHLTTAHALLDAVPPTPEVTVLPELFEEERVELESARPAGGPGARPSLVVALRHALSAVGTADMAEPDGGERARPRSSRPQLAREGAVWAVRWDGSTVRVRDAKGVRDLAVLLARPRQEVHALELMGAPDVGAAPGPVIDDVARRQYQARVIELQEDIEEAQRNHDPVRAEKAEVELDLLVQQLSEAFGISGRGRSSGSTVEKARTAVTYRIRATIKRLASCIPTSATTSPTPSGRARGARTNRRSIPAGRWIRADQARPHDVRSVLTPGRETTNPPAEEANPMSSLDQHGNPMSGGADAVTAYERATDALLRYSPAVIDGTTELVEHHPQAPMGHALMAYLYLTSTDAPDVAIAKDAWSAMGSLPMHDREQAHHDAIGAWIGGDWRAASASLDALLQRWPTDLLALQIGHQLDFFLGDAANLRDRPGRTLPELDPAHPQTAFVRGMQSFGLEESGDYGAAEAAGLAAVAVNPDDVWAIHAVTHVLEMQGRIDEGIHFLSTRRDDWGAGNLFSVHNWWHLALYLLEAGDVDEALAIYDAEVHHGDSAGVPLEMIDASALLWRLYLDGHDTGGRFEPLADVVGDPGRRPIVVRVQRPAPGHGARRRRADGGGRAAHRRPGELRAPRRRRHERRDGDRDRSAGEPGRAPVRAGPPPGRHRRARPDPPLTAAVRRLARSARRAPAHAARVRAPSRSARPGPGAGGRAAQPARTERVQLDPTGPPRVGPRPG